MDPTMRDRSSGLEVQFPELVLQKLLQDVQLIERIGFRVQGFRV